MSRFRAESTREEFADIAIAVVIDGGRVLVGQRPPGKPLAGYWEFPGGRVEAGESCRDAATRECREETGITIEVSERLSLVEHSYDHGAVRLHFYVGHPIGRGAPPKSPFLWVPVEELRHYRMPPANEGVQSQLAQRR